MHTVGRESSLQALIAVPTAVDAVLRTLAARAGRAAAGSSLDGLGLNGETPATCRITASTSLTALSTRARSQSEGWRWPGHGTVSFPVSDFLAPGVALGLRADQRILAV